MEVRRGEMVESVHEGDIAVVHRSGRLMWYLGDPHLVTFARSAAKPWQVVPLIESGAADAAAMSDEELALACASHSGEPMHVEKVLALLQRVGLGVEALRCGVHPPYSSAAYESLLQCGEPLTAAHNNCSGKHAAMLVLAAHLKADLERYSMSGHPVQTLILRAVSELTEVAPPDIALGTDGCGVPVFALPLARMALAYAKLADPSGEPEPRQSALQRISRAMTTHPEMVGGTDRFCTVLMQAGAGRIIGKLGAEGVYCVGLPELGLGLALKVADGHPRASYPAVVEALRQIGVLSETDLATLSAFHHPVLKNHQGTIVGDLRPVFQLHRAI